MRFNLTQYRPMNSPQSILSQKQKFRPVETNWMWKGKARRPSLPQPRCSAQLSALRIVVLGCWAYYLLLPPPTSNYYLLLYSASLPATILSPSPLPLSHQNFVLTLHPSTSRPSAIWFLSISIKLWPWHMIPFSSLLLHSKALPFSESWPLFYKWFMQWAHHLVDFAPLLEKPLPGYKCL